MTTITALMTAAAQGWSLYEGQAVDVEDSLASVLVQSGIARLGGEHGAETFSADLMNPTTPKRGRPRKEV